MKLKKGFKLKQLLLAALMSTVFIPFSYDFAAKTPISIKSQHASVHQQEIIVLIHGLMRTTWSMYYLKNYLEKKGYQVYSYSYPSSRYTIHEQSNYLHLYITQLIMNHPGIKIYFITHSLGGIIARDALAQFPEGELKKMGGLIMLAPPNQGSALAKLSNTLLPLVSNFIKPLAELSSEATSYVHKVPIPKIKIGIIAGRYDAKVPPASARLKGEAEPVIVNSTHTFIMNNTATKKLITHFLEKGTLVE